MYHKPLLLVLIMYHKILLLIPNMYPFPPTYKNLVILLFYACCFKANVFILIVQPILFKENVNDAQD